MPRNFLPIAIPRLRFSPPSGPEWLHEVKHDGSRAQLHSRNGDAVIYSQNGDDISERFAHIRDALSILPPCTIDAEIIGYCSDRTPDSGGVMVGNSAGFCAWCFDLLVIDGRDIRRCPLEERRARLKEMLFAADWTLIRFSDSFRDGEKLLAAAARLDLEGIVSKKRKAPYVAGRACGWIKVKTQTWREANRERYKLVDRV